MTPRHSDVVGFSYRVQVLERSLNILDSLAESGQELGPAELAARLSLHKTTVHRLLIVLERHGFARKNPLRGKYGLGMRLFELGNRAISQMDLRERAVPFLQQLVDATDETARVWIRCDAQMLCVASVEGSQQLRIAPNVGRLLPMHSSAVGKVQIAFLPDVELSELVAELRLTRHTRRTLVTRRAFTAELARVRRCGYALDNEEFEDGLRAIAVPVRDYTRHVTAAIAIAGPVFRITNERLPRLIRAAVVVARDLSTALGYTRQTRRAAATGVPKRSSPATGLRRHG